MRTGTKKKAGKRKQKTEKQKNGREKTVEKKHGIKQFVPSGLGGHFRLVSRHEPKRAISYTRSTSVPRLIQNVSVIRDAV